MDLQSVGGGSSLECSRLFAASLNLNLDSMQFRETANNKVQSENLAELCTYENSPSQQTHSMTTLWSIFDQTKCYKNPSIITYSKHYLRNTTFTYNSLQ